MTNCNIVIVDDEELARVLLRNYVSRLSHFKIVGECKNPLELLQILGNEKVDLIFLDIQMPELTGLDFLRSVKPNTDVIITTAYSEYALEGFELNVLDYLHKPFGFDRFTQAISKFQERRQGQIFKPDLSQNSSIETPTDHILVKSEHKIHRIPLCDVKYIKGMREYISFHCVNGERIMTIRSLKNLESELPQSQFIHVHKSYIVAKRHAKTLEGRNILIGEDKIPIGASYRDRVIDQLFTAL